MRRAALQPYCGRLRAAAASRRLCPQVFFVAEEYQERIPAPGRTAIDVFFRTDYGLSADRLQNSIRLTCNNQANFQGLHHISQLSCKNFLTAQESKG